MSILKTAVSKATDGRNIIILMGGPGAGKGTQAERITDWLRVPHISTGQLLRSEAMAGTVLGLRTKAIMDAGRLVADDVVDATIAERIIKEDCNAGIVLDGYPRNIRQAVAFEGSLPMKDRQIVIDIAIDLEKIIPRLTARRTCGSCEEIYHLITSPPLRAGLCDQCNEPLIHRSDDCEDVIRERFRTYTDWTRPLTGLYRRMGIYHQVDGMRRPDQVAGDIRRVLEQEICIGAPAEGFAVA